MKNMDPYCVAEAIGVPVEKWPANCYSIASKIVKSRLVRGRLCYGHYHGYIHPDNERFGGRPFTHHGWVERRVTIYDPTRWFFELTAPYIYVGPKQDDEYDFGGNRVRKEFMRPAPPFNGSQKIWIVPDHLRPFAWMMLGPQMRGDLACAAQIGWLASLPLDLLNDMAEVLFLWVVNDVGFPGFIPVDNRRLILGR